MLERKFNGLEERVDVLATKLDTCAVNEDIMEYIN